MSQQSVRQAARRSALDAQAVLRKERADRERRLEALAVAVLTALGECEALVRDAERRAGQALRTMTEDEGLSVREAVKWCGNGIWASMSEPAVPVGRAVLCGAPDICGTARVVNEMTCLGSPMTLVGPSAGRSKRARS